LDNNFWECLGFRLIEMKVWREDCYCTSFVRWHEIVQGVDKGLYRRYKNVWLRKQNQSEKKLKVVQKDEVQLAFDDRVFELWLFKW